MMGYAPLIRSFLSPLLGTINSFLVALKLLAGGLKHASQLPHVTWASAPRPAAGNWSLIRWSRALARARV